MIFAVASNLLRAADITTSLIELFTGDLLAEP
jgi:hypothetical protein